MLGTWVDVAECIEMKYRIAIQDEQLIVSAVDTLGIEDEEGDVSDIYWDEGGSLHFNVYWSSSGYFRKCQFLLVSPNRINFTYTHTEKIMMVRKHAENNETNTDHPFIGTWIDNLTFACELEYTVAIQNEQLIVCVVDRYDDDKGMVYDISKHGEELHFSVYWQSTGRFLRCQLNLISPDEVLLTYMYTERCVLTRQ